MFNFKNLQVMMKKIIYVAVTVMLLVGCTTKNEPSNSQKVPVSTTSLDVDYYEQIKTM
jgi:PBP1b-binding outer membrane lipoprotein LpoB